MEGVGRRISSKRLERWYAQLQQSLAAGIDLPSALEQCGGPPARDRSSMAQALRNGRAVDAVLEAAPAWLPNADRLLLSSGAASGKLPETCAALSEEHGDLAANQRALIIAVLYPLVILHGAMFLLPAAKAISIDENGSPQFSVERYIEIFLALLIGIWGSLALGILLKRLFPKAAERIMRCLPGLGAYWKHRCLARFAATLHALLESGARYVEAVGGAALAVDDTRMTPAVLSHLGPIENGQSFSAVLPDLKAFPLEFGHQFRTAEQTGSLHHTLPKLAEEHRKSARTALFHVSFWYPKLLFLLAAVAVGWSVASVYGEYLNFVLSMAE